MNIDDFPFDEVAKGHWGPLDIIEATTREVLKDNDKDHHKITAEESKLIGDVLSAYKELGVLTIASFNVSFNSSFSSCHIRFSLTGSTTDMFYMYGNGVAYYPY